MAIATIMGSITAGLLTEKLKTGKLSCILSSLGIFIIPAGIIVCITGLLTAGFFKSLEGN